MQSKIRQFILLMLAAGLVGVVQPAESQDLEQSEDFNKGGRTAFQFLKIGIGARQAGLGEASIALVRDVNSVFWNPANIAAIESGEASFSYTRWLADMNYVSGAVGARWNGVGVFALSIASLDYGDIPEAVVAGGQEGDGRTGASFSGGDLMVGLAYTREFTDRLAIGINLKMIRESLATGIDIASEHFVGTAGSFAFDVGTNYNLGYRGIRLSMAAQNFAGSVKWLGDDSDRIEGYDLPLIFRIGMSTHLVGGQDAFFDAGPDHRVALSAEAINTNDYSERVNLGLEYTFTDFLSLRGGYRFNYAEGKWAAGVGLNPGVSGVALRLDYAYVHYEFLDAPHRFSVSMAF
ncbi:MAG: PorV/PorQ family protein [Bacteroidota bacterium]